MEQEYTEKMVKHNDDRDKIDGIRKTGVSNEKSKKVCFN